ncbi:MAG: cyclic nucleotide-binding domain-containing protein [Clostridia bacterium]|nr:cyclic nucleotide-binding domain-containing protein [Clostridia bacterium]
MRTTVVIPSYWSRVDNAWQPGDAVYDHPTPINGEGTLGRTLESMKILNNKKFKLVIPICPTCKEVEEAAEKRVREIVEKADLNIETYIFTAENLRTIRGILIEKGMKDDQVNLLNIHGYSNVRNICLFVSHILSSEVTILIDDDENFENPDFINMAKEYIGKRVYGKGVYGVAGYYLNKYDEFYDDVEMVPWMTYWDRFGSKTKAFDKIISCDPRLKVTPFAFGGLMVIHKNLFKTVAFDPDVTRGEDIDYLVNAKMFGFDFFLDNKLNIKHLPPKKNHPIWKRFREDIYRFLYEQAKIRSQVEVNNMTMVKAKNFDPYPGDFLKDDLEDKIYKTNVLLALEYLADGDIEGCKESIKNIYLSKYEAIPKDDPFTKYRRVQKIWTQIMEMTSKERTVIRRVMEENNLSHSLRSLQDIEISSLSKEEIILRIKHFEDFKDLDEAELKLLADITSVRGYKQDEIVFQIGDTNLEFMMIIKGCVRISKFNDSNEEITLANICSNGVIGETSLIKEKYNVVGIADEFTEMLVMKKEDLEGLIASDPKLGVKMLYIILERLYYKLNKTNLLYRDKIMQEEGLPEMN